MTTPIKKRELELFRAYRRNPLLISQTEVRKKLGIPPGHSTEFYRRFHKAWKIDRLNREDLNPQK